MKNHNFIRRAVVVLLCCLLLGAFLVTAAAETTGSLAVSYPLEGTVYHIYRVGSLKNGGIVMDPQFSRVDTSDYAAAASRMAKMVKVGAAKELAKATVQNGKALFYNLPMAVYLVTGDPGEQDGVQYWPTPFLLSIPQRGENDAFQWEVTAEGKREMEMNISVSMSWAGDMLIYRPTKATVRLMRDGSAYGNPVTLNYVNSWSHTWKNLPPGNWSVTEDVNARYSAKITREGNAFTITNLWKQIPQTGQLWWPVSVMALAGLLLICLGLLRRKGRGGHD